MDHWSVEPACQSGPDVATYPVLLPPTLGEHVEQNVSLATSSDADFRRPVRVTALRRADVCGIEPGPALRKHASLKAVYPRCPMGVRGAYRATRPIPGRIFGAVPFFAEKRTATNNPVARLPRPIVPVVAVPCEPPLPQADPGVTESQDVAPRTLLTSICGPYPGRVKRPRSRGVTMQRRAGWGRSVPRVRTPRSARSRASVVTNTRSSGHGIVTFVLRWVGRSAQIAVGINRIGRSTGSVKAHLGHPGWRISPRRLDGRRTSSISP